MKEKEIINALAKNTILCGTICDYRIEKALGQGTFGITYIATVKLKGPLGQIDSKGKVAIKEFFMRDVNGRVDNMVIAGSRSGQFDYYKRAFVREAKNLSKLEHSNIVKVLELFEANDTVYYVMDYHEGGSLDAYIYKHNGIPEVEAIGYIKQIGDALSYMHKCKMLHLDLKPGNIVLNSNGEAVLIDFGLSKQYDESGNPESSTSIGGGTPGYAPIEQSNYRAGHDFPVTMDVYALGATFYKMLTGKTPVNASEILNEGFQSYELQKKGVSEHTISCIKQAMQPLKKDRCSTVEDFIDLFDTAYTTGNEMNDPDMEDTIGDLYIEPEYTPFIDMNKSGISIFYENNINGKTCISILNNGGGYSVRLDENMLLFNGNVSINEPAIDNIFGETHYVYDSLKEHIESLNIKNDILKSRKVIIAYDDRISYCDAIRLIIDIFGSMPSNFRIISKLHLVAFYCGANAMNTDDELYLRLIRGESSCKICTGEGIVHIHEDTDNTDGIFPLTRRISPDSSKELIAGVVLLHLILLKYKEAKGFLLLDSVPFDISCGFSSDEFKIVIPSYSTIPTRNIIELDKTNHELNIQLGQEIIKYPLLEGDDKSISICAEIGADGIIRFEIGSSNGYRKSVSVVDLLSDNFSSKQERSRAFSVGKDLRAVFIEYKDAFAPRFMENNYSYTVTKEELNPECYQQFLRDLQNLDIRIRESAVNYSEGDYSETPGRLDLHFYDEYGHHHLWITGWNNECGNIIGDINKLHDKLNEIVPGLKEYRNAKKKEVKINIPNEEQDKVQDEDAESKGSWYFPIFMLLIIPLYCIVAPFFQVPFYGWFSIIFYLIGVWSISKDKSCLGMLSVLVAVGITTAGFFIY